MIRKIINQYLNKYYFRKNPVKYARKLGVKVGQGCRIATNYFGSEPYLIDIGDNCHITKGVRFINHDGGVWVFRKDQTNFDVFGKIKIGNNVYIGNDSVILPGVKIGDNCVIGAQSIVTKSIPDNSVVAGVPAKFICSLDVYESRLSEHNFETKQLKGDNKKKRIMELIDSKGIKKPFLNI